jgi:superfamily II DNA/RNA helicase
MLLGLMSAGTGVIIISPTRELALQIFGVAKELMGGHSQTFGVLMGGANRKAEADKLAKGVISRWVSSIYMLVQAKFL